MNEFIELQKKYIFEWRWTIATSIWLYFDLHTEIDLRLLFLASSLVRALAFPRQTSSKTDIKYMKRFINLKETMSVKTWSGRQPASGSIRRHVAVYVKRYGSNRRPIAQYMSSLFDEQCYKDRLLRHRLTVWTFVALKYVIFGVWTASLDVEHADKSRSHGWLMDVASLATVGSKIYITADSFATKQL